MNIRRNFASWLSLALLLFAGSAVAQIVPYQIELGYRWVDVSGNNDMYRTQVNERSGFLIRSFTLSSNDFNGHASYLDHFRMDMTDLGVGPAGALRLDAGKSGVYRVTLGYRQTNQFSALPTLANPFLGQGIIPGQHTYDRDRKMLDADVEILAFSKFSPFVGFSWNRYSGPGTTTYDLGLDEFQLANNLTDRDREFRVGTGFTFGNYFGQVTQGWRNYRTRETFALAPGANAGNNPGSSLGRQINLTSFNRESNTDGKTPFTNAWVSGQVVKRLKLIGNYSRFSADSNGDETESGAGSLGAFGIGRFFNGINETVDARAKNTTWRGGARAEVAITDTMDFLAGYQTEHRDLSGSSLINTLYLQSVTFGGLDPRDVAAVLNTDNSLNRKEDLLSAAFSARAVGPFAFRLGVQQSKRDVSVTPDLSEIVIPGAQGGNFDRRVRSFDANGTYGIAGLSIGAKWRHDDADKPIFRTDYLNRDLYRLRAGYNAPKYVRLGLTAEETRQNNDRPDTGFTGKIRQYTGDLAITPVEMLELRAAYSQYRSNTDISYRRPETFAIGESTHRERGKSVEGGFGLNFNPVTVDLGLSRFDNTGTYPFKLDRVRARLTYDLKVHAGIAAEFDRDKYTDNLISLADYEASRYGVYLRWRP